MGINGDTCWDEHRRLYVRKESLNSIPESNVTLYVDKLEFKQKFGRQKKKSIYRMT